MAVGKLRMEIIIGMMLMAFQKTIKAMGQGIITDRYNIQDMLLSRANIRYGSVYSL